VSVLAAYGHSWVQGSAAATTAKRFVNLATSRLGLALENKGVGGALSTETAGILSARPPAAAEFYVLMTGLNDARRYGWRSTALDDYRSALVTILDAFIAANPRSLVVTVAQPHLCDYSQHPPYDRSCDELLDAYNRQLEAVTNSYPQVTLATAERWDKRSMLAMDTVHPNDLGHYELSRAVGRVLEASRT
jgi:lysophospholipase L1-like esterase